MRFMLLPVLLLMGLSGLCLIVAGVAVFGTSIALPGLGLIVSGSIILPLGIILTVVALAGFVRLRRYR